MLKWRWGQHETMQTLRQHDAAGDTIVPLSLYKMGVGHKICLLDCCNSSYH